MERRTRRRGRPDAGFSARAQILDGAAKQFGALGYTETSVEDILSAADVSRRTFYRFFRNKEEVLQELFETSSLLLVQAIKAAIMVGKSREERIDNAIEVFVRAPQTVGPLAMIFHVEAARAGSPLAPRREAIIEQIIALLDEEVRADVGDDSLEVHPLIYRGLIAALEQISLQTYTNTAASDEDLTRAKSIMMLFVDRVLHDLENFKVP